MFPFMDKFIFVHIKRAKRLDVLQKRPVGFHDAQGVSKSLRVKAKGCWVAE